MEQRHLGSETCLQGWTLGEEEGPAAQAAGGRGASQDPIPSGRGRRHPGRVWGRQEGDTRWSVSGTCLATSEKGQRGAWSGRENGVCMKVGGARGRVDGSDCGSGRGQGV